MAIAVDVANLGTNITASQPTSLDITTTSAVASGGFIVVCGGWFGDNTLTPTVSGGGLTWTTDKLLVPSGSNSAFIASAQAPSGLASSSTITVTWGAPGAVAPTIGAMSFTGVATSSPVDGTSTAGEQSSTTAWATDSQTLTAGSVLIGTCRESASGTGSTPDAGSTEAWDISDGTDNFGQTTCYRIEASSGSYSVSGTWGGSTSSGDVGVAYLADTGGSVFGVSSSTYTLGVDSFGSPGPVAYDAFTEGNRTDTSDPYTFNHTGRAEANGGVQGVVVTAVHGTSSTDHISSMTYGGVSMSRVITATDTVTEPGRADIWFVGSGLSGKGGTQTISADLTSGTTDDITFTAITLLTNDGSDIEVIDSDLVQENAANPSVTLQYGGRYAIAIGALYGGGAAPSSFTPNGNCTEVASQDLGAFYAFTLRQTVPGTSDFAIGGTAVSDDVAYVAAAFAKVVPAGTSYPLQRRSNAHLLAR